MSIVNGPYSIRVATPSDAAALADFGQAAFRDTFAASSRPDDLERYVAETFSHAQIRTELEARGCHHWVSSSEAGTVVGSVKLREGDPPPCVKGPAAVEIQRLYVSKVSIGTGLGAALMRVALRWAGERGFDSVWLGVWEHNHRALAFYRRWGFTAVGQQLFQLGADAQTDLIMERRVRPDEADAG